MSKTYLNKKDQNPAEKKRNAKQLKSFDDKRPMNNKIEELQSLSHETDPMQMVRFAADTKEEEEEEVFDHAAAKEKLEEDYGTHDAFTGGKTIDKSKLSMANRNGFIPGAEMKRLRKYKIDGKDYVEASMKTGKKDSKFNNLGREAKALGELHAAGLDVPQVYRTSDDETDKSGVGINAKSEPFILMDFVNGSAMDLWKNPDGAAEVLTKHITGIASPNELFKMRSGFDQIKKYLQKHVVVDLQVMLEDKTGRTVIIDPLKIYKMAEVPPEKAKHKDQNKKSIDTIGVLDGIIVSSLEKGWQPPVAKGDYSKTNEKIGRGGSGTDRAPLSQQSTGHKG